MGLYGAARRCSTNYTDSPQAVAPDPKNWTLLDKVQFENAHVLRVQYPNCTNFEGIKIMVFVGKFRSRLILDPHFDESKSSPIARFKPTKEGWELALQFAKNYQK